MSPPNTITVEINNRENAPLVLEIVSRALTELYEGPYRFLPQHSVILYPVSEGKHAEKATLDLKQFQAEAKASGKFHFFHKCSESEKRVRTRWSAFKDWVMRAEKHPHPGLISFSFPQHPAASVLRRECNLRRVWFEVTLQTSTFIPKHDFLLSQNLLRSFNTSKSDERFAELVQTLFLDSGRGNDTTLLNSVVQYIDAHGGELSFEHLMDILFVHRPQFEGKIPPRDIPEWIETMTGEKVSLEPWVGAAISARFVIKFPGFMPQSLFEMLTCSLLRFYTRKSHRSLDERDPFFGTDPLTFLLEAQRLFRSMSEFRFSVGQNEDIVFRIMGPPLLSSTIYVHPDFSLSKSIKSHFDGPIGSLLESKEHKLMKLYNEEGGRSVVVRISNKYVEWELSNSSLENDINASIWFLSLSYRLSFDTIFNFMSLKHAKKAVFVSNMSPDTWKDRYEVEAKECKDRSNSKLYVQLRPESDEFYGKALKWEHELLTEFSGGAPLQCYRLQVAQEIKNGGI